MAGGGWARGFATWLALLASAVGNVWAQATESPTAAPSLRIEVGSHTGPIRAISADHAGRYAVTAAEDKTARVWEIETARLVQVFRAPSGPDNDGKLFAASMLGDGSLFAVGGWTAANDVYLVARSSGQVIHRLTGLPNVITSLAFSPDGRHLAVGLWGRHGIRLFSGHEGWRKVIELRGDSDVGGDIHGLAWAPDGSRLAATSADGFVRQYRLNNEGLGPVRRQHPQELEVPFGVSYAPDGGQLAVGSGDRAKVALLRGDDLALMAIMSAREEMVGSLPAVAWVGHGKQVLAAGTWRDQRGNFHTCVGAPGSVQCADQGGVASNTVTAVASLPNGGALFATAGPSWGTMNAAGRRAQEVAVGLADFRGMRADFTLAPDGSAINVFSQGAVTNATGFDLAGLAWRFRQSTWTSALTQSGRHAITDWFESSRPLLDGRPLLIAANELSMTAALSAKGDRVALGTSFFVRCYDASGRELWRRPAPATTWQVNISRDGRWLVAGFGDGTVRWYRLRDGTEHLALLPLPDRRRWVAWTPSGYFAVSPGGEELLGWQVERGGGRGADFFPLSRFRGDYHRPELLAAVIAQGDEQAALATSHPKGETAGTSDSIIGRLPPVVRILAPQDGQSTRATQIKLAVAADAAADAPVVGLRVRINGAAVTLPDLPSLRTVASPTGPESGSPVFEVPVPLPEADADVMVFAENRHGVSPPAVVRILRPESGLSKASGASAARGDEPLPGGIGASSAISVAPALYVLAIGVSRYADKSIRLEYSAKDAQDLATFFRSQEGLLYRKVTVRLLVDEQARRDDILDGLDWIRRQTTARDVGVVFLAGHGVNDPDGVYYFLPQDTEVKRLKRTGLIFTEIRNTLVALPGKALFFVDTCHSGNILGTALRAIGGDTTAIVNELTSAENGVIVFTATTGRQYAQESDAWGNGAFTKAILEGLAGQADFGRSGRITHKMLDLYVSERVKALTEGNQSPVTIVPRGVPDFPLAIPQPKR